MEIAPGVYLNHDDVREQFTGASGPGGQHVNKSDTAVRLQLDLKQAEGIPYPIKQRLRVLAGRRVSADDVLTVTASAARSQYRNRAEAWERLIALIRAAVVRPRSRKKTKPTRASAKRRLQHKKHRSGVKQMRGKVRDDD